MPIPGPYPVVTTPGTTTPGTTTPGTTPGTPGAGGGWWRALLEMLGGDLAKYPGLRDMLQSRLGGQGRVGGWPTGADATGWWGEAQALMPTTLPDLRAKHGLRFENGQLQHDQRLPWQTAQPIDPGSTTTADPMPWFPEWLAKQTGGRGADYVSPPPGLSPLAAQSAPASGRLQYGMGSGSVAGSSGAGRSGGSSAAGSVPAAVTSPTSWLSSLLAGWGR